MKRVIITGANGFIGSSLVHRLLEEGTEVVALDISFENRNIPELDGVRTLEMGLDDAGKLVEAIGPGEYDVFYHFAWQGVNGPDKANPAIQLNNINLALHCAEAAKALGCGKLLCAGTIAERSAESLPRLQHTGGGMLYGVAKHCARLMLETYCKSIGLDFVWMQFSNIYGPHNKTGNLVSYTIGQLLADRDAEFGPALQPYDFIYVKDLIEAIYRIGEKPNRHNSYFIGSGQPRLLREYLMEIGQQMGKPERICLGKRSDDGIVYTSDMFDTTRLKEDIGDYTSMSFEKGIAYTLKKY